MNSTKSRSTTRFDNPDWADLYKAGRKLTLDEWRELGFDRNSVFADPMFVDPDNGDYRVKPESPAIALGFENFDMDSFGITTEFPDTWGKK